MRRLLPLLLLLFAAPVYGQQTIVTATIKDPNGVPYAFGTGSGTLVCPGNQQPTVRGAPVPRTITITGLDGNGTFTQTFYDVNGIDQTGCAYRFSITDKSTAISFTTGLLSSVTGASVNLSAAISAFSVPLPSQGGGSGAFSYVTVVSGPSPVFNASQNTGYSFTLSSNAVATFGAPNAGTIYQINLCENATGGFTFTFPANVVLPAGFSFNTAASVCNQVAFIYDGTNWQPWTVVGSVVPSGNQGDLQLKNSGVLGASSVNDSGGVVNIAEPTNVNASLGIKGPTPWRDVMRFGVYTKSPSVAPAVPGITAGTSSGSPNVTISSASSFINGAGVNIFHAGPAITMPTPAAPTVTPSMARVGTATGDIVTAPSGASTFNYKIIAEDISGGYTAASATGSTTTGNTLGSRSVTISSLSRAAQQVTVTTSAAHGLPVGCGTSTCPFVIISGSSDNTFNGWQHVDSVADTTHFTYTAGISTASGGSTSATGGTAFWFNLNHVTWSSVAGAFRYYIYSDRVTPGTFALIGVSKPVEGIFVSGTLYFDDFGSPMSDGFTAFPAYVPATAPASAANDNLLTTISSGAGTTSLVLNANAGATVSGATILVDDSPAIVASCGANATTLLSSQANVVINSVLQLQSSFCGLMGGAGITINDTMMLNASVKWDGSALPIAGSQGSFTFFSNPEIFCHASPCILGIGTMEISNLQIDPLGNGQTLMINDGGGGGALPTYENIYFGGTGNDHTNINLWLRGQAGQAAAGGHFTHVNLNGQQLALGATATPALYCDDCGFLDISSIFLSGRGIQDQPDPAGSRINLSNFGYIQGGTTPFFTVAGVNQSGNAAVALDLSEITLDTDPSPLLVYLPSAGTSSVSVSIKDLTNLPAGTSVLTGAPVLYVNGTASGQNVNSVATYSGNTGVNGSIVGTNADFTNELVSVRGTGAIGYQMSIPSAPTATVAAGGSLANGTYFYYILAYDVNGNSTSSSPASTSCTTTTGNNTCNVSWSLLPGQAHTTVCRGPSPGNEACASTGSGFFITGTTFSDSGSFFPNNSAPQVNIATVSSINSASVSTPQVNLFGGGFTNSLVSSPTANRTQTFLDNTGTVPNYNFSGTWTALQTFSSPISLANTSYEDIGTRTNPGNPVSGNIRLYADSSTGFLTCLTTTGSNACPGSGGTTTPGGSNTQVQVNVSGTLGAFNTFTFVNPALTLGLNGTATGQLKFQGTTSGTVTVQPADAAGTWTFKWPTSSGTNAFPLTTDGTGISSWSLLTVPGGGSGAGTFTANQLIAGNGTSPLQSLAGSTIGTNPLLKLQPSSAANTALTLDTAAAPTADILDLNVNGTKTSWFDSAAALHVSQVTNGAGTISLSGIEGTCPSPVVGTDIVCLGDSATHSSQVSNNGGNLKPIAAWSNGSPTAHGVVIANTTFPWINSTAAGTSGQPFLSGGSSADGAYGPLNLAGGSSIITGICPIANGCTGSSTLAGANIVTVTGAITSGHCSQWSSSTVITDSGGACGGAGGNPPLNTITAATTSNIINSTTNPQTWNWALTGSTTAFKFGENTAATGSSNILLQATTASASTAIPFRTDNNGNGYQLSSTGLWQPLGTGALATPGAAHNLVVSQAGSTAVSYVPPVAAGKILIDNGPGADPSFQDPVISPNTPAESTAAWTSTTTANSAVTVSISGALGFNTVVVTLNQGSTITAGAVTFEVSDTTAFTNAYNSSCWQQGGSTITSTYTLAASTNQAFVCNIASFPAFRVRLNTAITGSGTVNVGVQPSAAVSQPYVAVAGTVTTTPPANASANIAQVAGTTISVNNGTTDAGTTRVTLSSDSTGQVKANQGNSGSNAQAWWAQIGDTANGPVAVKAASTAAVAADKALVVAISPNNSVAVTGTFFQTTQPVSGTVTANQGTNPWTDTGNLSDNGAASGANRVASLPAIARTNLPAAATAGRDGALNTNLHGGLRTAVIPDTDLASYSANKLGLAPAATATDIAVLPGNATNTVIVTRIQVTCTQTTAGIIDLQLIKRSTADTAGTSAAMTIVPLDSADAAAVSAPLTYTANPTTGTLVGNVDSVKLACLATGTASPADIYIWTPAAGQSIVLRGTAQQLAVNLNGVTVTGGSFNVTFSWIETTNL